MIGYILAICISERKGERKKNVRKGFLKENIGLEGDANAGYERQISILSLESMFSFPKEILREIENEEYWENIMIFGINPSLVYPKAKLKFGESAIVEITSI